MATRAEQVVEVPGTVEEAVAMAWAALAAYPKLKGPPTMTGPGSMQGRTGMNFRTWGDLITIEVREGPAGTRVRVASELIFGVIDWGRTAEHVGALVAALGPSRPGF